MRRRSSRISLLQAILTVFVLLPVEISRAQSLRLPDPGPRIDCWADGFLYRPPLPPKPDTVRIRIIGDMMQHTLQLEAAYAEYRAAHPDDRNPSPARSDNYLYTISLAGIEEDLRSADLAIANAEFALGGAPFSGYPTFSTPESYPDYMVSCGIDVFLTANNHILDKGYGGLKRTLAYYDGLEEKGLVRHTGCSLDKDDDRARNPLFVRLKGLKLAVINCTYGANFPIKDGFPKVNRMNDRDSLLSCLRRAREEDADLVLVIPHWGSEYVLRHGKSQESTARWLAANGADVIVGAHPHVVQDFQEISVKCDDGIKKVPVYYSIGNAHSNMSAANTQLELMVTVTAVRQPDGSVTLEGVDHDWLWCSRPGFLNHGYTTFKVKDYLGRRGEWINRTDYDKMVSTLERVSSETGLRK